MWWRDRVTENIFQSTSANTSFSSNESTTEIEQCEHSELDSIVIDESAVDLSSEILLSDQEATVNKLGIREKIHEWTLDNLNVLPFSTVT